MNLEIERKFLLKSIPDKKPIDRIKINQWYRKNSSGIWERARSCYSDENGIYFIHTIKTHVSPGVNMEDEKHLTSSDFNDFVKKCKKSSEARYIFKERFIYEHHEHDLLWEVDVFQNEHHLIVGEIELKSEDYDLTLPKFIKNELLMEVTEFKQFSNKNLSNKVKTKNG